MGNLDLHDHDRPAEHGRRGALPKRGDQPQNLDNRNNSARRNIQNKGDKGGCVLLPKGNIGVFTGNTTVKCNEDLKEVTGTDLTTPGNFVEGSQIDCTVNGVATK